MNDLAGGVTALDILDLGSASQRRNAARYADAELVVELVRPLVEGDIDILRHPPAKPSREAQDDVSQILRITNSHHQIARVLAVGTNNTKTAALTGHSPAYIARLQKDPAFRDLLAYYAQNQEMIFVEANERMKAFGLDLLEELHSRFMDDPASFSRKELAELTELYLVKSQAAKGLAAQGSAAGARPQVSIGISFVRPATEGGPGAMILEGESIDVTEC